MHHHHIHHHGEKQQEHKDHDHGSSAKKWQELNPNYASMDAAPQTFFYTLSNLMKLQESKNILQIGCGAGKLLSTVLDLKAPNTFYNATDLSEGMVKQSKNRLKAHFQKYKSQLTFEDWLKEQNFTFSVENGQCVTSPKQKYDRIISNMVLCHAKDPYKMLKNWHQISTEDCILGASLAGNPDRNPLVKMVRQSAHEVNEKSEDLPPWYWYDKILGILDQTGWEVIIHWEQNALFPSLNPYDQHLSTFLKRVPPKAQGAVNQKVQKIFKQEKSGLQFWCLAFVAKKKSAL